MMGSRPHPTWHVAVVVILAPSVGARMTAAGRMTVDTAIVVTVMETDMMVDAIAMMMIVAVAMMRAGAAAHLLPMLMLVVKYVKFMDILQVHAGVALPR